MKKLFQKNLSNASPLRKYAELGKIMFAMLKDVKKGNYPNVPWFTIASIVVALLYVFNPFDLVPDFIPGVGYIDDLAVSIHQHGLDRNGSSQIFGLAFGGN